MKIFLASILLLTFPFFLSSETAVGIQTASNDEYPLVTTNLNNELLLKLVNEKRATGCNCGSTYMPPVAPLSWNNTIAFAASNHSKDMNKNNFFSHDSYNGQKLRDRFTAVGYKWMAIAENIANGQKDEYAVFNAWLKSDGHCRNMMDGAYKEMGAAKEGRYWTQDFGTKRNW